MFYSINKVCPEGKWGKIITNEKEYEKLKNNNMSSVTETTIEVINNIKDLLKANGYTWSEDINIISFSSR